MIVQRKVSEFEPSHPTVPLSRVSPTVSDARSGAARWLACPTSPRPSRWLRGDAPGGW